MTGLMLNFFRRIRKQLAKDNQFRRYFRLCLWGSGTYYDRYFYGPAAAELE